MRIAAKLALAAAMLLTMPSPSAARQWDFHDRIRMREDVRRQVRDTVRHARRDAWAARWQARRDAQRMAWTLRRDALHMQRDMMRRAYRHRHRWRD